MAQALLHSTVEMTVLPLCLIKKKTTCMVTAVATYPTYHTIPSRCTGGRRHGYCYCVGIHVLQTDKTG